jgi:hypothetical protein
VHRVLVFIFSNLEHTMNAKYLICIALVAITSGCSNFGAMRGGGDGEGGSEGRYMSGHAPVEVDPAGSATMGTGSIATTSADQRVTTSAGLGTDD